MAIRFRLLGHNWTFDYGIRHALHVWRWSRHFDLARKHQARYEAIAQERIDRRRLRASPTGGR